MPDWLRDSVPEPECLALKEVLVMNVPGFSAEASLYPASQPYVVTDAPVEPRSSVIPQARIILDGFCIGNGRYCCFRGSDGKWSCGRTIST